MTESHIETISLVIYFYTRWGPLLLVAINGSLWAPYQFPYTWVTVFFSHPYKVAVLTDSYMKDLTFHSLIFINFGSWYDLPAVYLRLMLEDWLCPTPPPRNKCFFYSAPQG